MNLNRRARFWWSVLLIMAITLGLGLVASAKEMVIKAAHSMPVTYHYHDGMLKFAEEVERLSNGTMKVEVYPAAQLGEERVTMEALKMGAIPVVLTGITDIYAPRTGVFALPYVFRDSDHADRVLNGPIGQEVYSDLMVHNMRVISVWDNGFRQITNNRREINSVEDMKGLKIRVPESPVWISTMRAFGATPTSMPFAETATAIAQGLVDGQENSILHILANKTYEIQDHIAIVNYMYGAAPLLVNEPWFRRLTDEQREIILQAAATANAHMRAVAKEREQEALRIFEEAGLTVTYPDLSGFREAAKKVHDQFSDQFGADLIQRILDSE